MPFQGSVLHLRSGNSGLISLQRSRTRRREHRPGSGVRLNTYSDSVGPARVHHGPQPAFQRRDRTPRRDPETHGSTPRGYPFKLKAAVPSGGTPVFCGLASGADAPNWLRLAVMAGAGLSEDSRGAIFRFAGAEDRATQGCDPSAVSSLIDGRGGRPFGAARSAFALREALPVSVLKR